MRSLQIECVLDMHLYLCTCIHVQVNAADALRRGQAEAVLQYSDGVLGRRLIYFHHIIASGKRQAQIPRHFNSGFKSEDNMEPTFLLVSIFSIFLTGNLGVGGAPAPGWLRQDRLARHYHCRRP